ncbi:hypothetical protein QP027_09630 [Corynebacterium breve]|uniref:Lipoprotein n=1 Tax=Corynebacterium breve TaxID=3049799 RepID=A0ABY8VGF7_9CORY|nr:hypothetical protein [Corynebacterium breve]WIM67353.1 hypothetical protein QP027_09630 [Corynebacterium breve]
MKRVVASLSAISIMTLGVSGCSFDISIGTTSSTYAPPPSTASSIAEEIAQPSNAETQAICDDFFEVYDEFESTPNLMELEDSTDIADNREAINLQANMLDSAADVMPEQHKHIFEDAATEMRNFAAMPDDDFQYYFWEAGQEEVIEKFKATERASTFLEELGCYE